MCCYLRDFVLIKPTRTVHQVVHNIIQCVNHEDDALVPVEVDLPFVILLREDKLRPVRCQYLERDIQDSNVNDESNHVVDS